VKQYTSEKSEEPTELKIYTGADGKFHWYDDDGATFAYEQGQYMLVHCDWDDKKRILTLQRDPAGKLGAGRQVRIKIAGTDSTKTISLSEKISRVEL
jgi:alpha-glucosidase (family GH31 glycosyl hydrolase)